LTQLKASLVARPPQRSVNPRNGPSSHLSGIDDNFCLDFLSGFRPEELLLKQNESTDPPIVNPPPTTARSPVAHFRSDPDRAMHFTPVGAVSNWNASAWCPFETVLVISFSY
jgi:hypothetical protein